MSYTEYIRNNFRVEDKATDLPKVYKFYKTIDDIRKCGGPDFVAAVDDLWGKKLTRQNVFDIFKKDLYKGYVAAMLWGGLGADGKTRSSLMSAMGYSREEIESRLKYILSCYDKGDIEGAFKSFLPPEKGNPEYGINKIAGIDISYFTKILYFLAPLASKPLHPTPLIYDKWGWHIHAALLLEEDANSDLFSFFSISAEIREGKGGYYLIPAVSLKNSKGSSCRAYIDYIKRLSNLSKNSSCDPGRMEEFLFGYSLNTHRSLSNPRIQLMDHLSEDLLSMYKGKEFGKYSDYKQDGNSDMDKTSKDVEITESYRVEVLGSRDVLHHDEFMIGGSGAILALCKGSKGLEDKTLPFCCALVMKDKKTVIRELICKEGLGSILELLPAYKKGKAKYYIFNNDITTQKGAEDLYNKVSIILSK